MKTLLCVFIFFFVVAMVFRWAWNAFLRDFCIVLLPDRDHRNAEEMEDMFKTYDEAYRDKKRKK